MHAACSADHDDDTVGVLVDITHEAQLVFLVHVGFVDLVHAQEIQPQKPGTFLSCSICHLGQPDPAQSLAVEASSVGRGLDINIEQVLRRHRVHLIHDVGAGLPHMTDGNIAGRGCI